MIVVGRYLPALLALVLFPAQPLHANPAYCKVIQCISEGIDAGLLTGPWKEACEKSEVAARNKCIETGGTEIWACNHVCSAGSWPTDDNRDNPPTAEALKEALEPRGH